MREISPASPVALSAVTIVDSARTRLGLRTPGADPRFDLNEFAEPDLPRFSFLVFSSLRNLRRLLHD